MPQAWPLGGCGFGPRAPISPVWVSPEALSAGWVGLVAEIRVEQAFGMFLLYLGLWSAAPVPGFLGTQLSMCDSGIDMYFHQERFILLTLPAREL